MSWLRQAPDGSLTLTLHAQPGAKHTEFAGLHGEALKVRLAAPPVDGKANACLIEFIADYCKQPQKNIKLISGESSRQKVVRIQNGSPELHQKLLKLGNKT